MWRLEEIQKIRSANAIRFVAGRRRVVELYRRHVLANRVIDAADETAIVRQADHDREHALRNAVGHIDAVRLAPLRNDVTLVNDKTSLIATFPDRTDRVSERLATERLVMI